MDKLCEYCGEPILPVNQEKHDEYRDEYYCERCEDRYWEEIEAEEGGAGYLLKI